MLLPRNLQITLSRQSHDENWVCSLLFFHWSEIQNICWIFFFFFFTNWLHGSKRNYPGNSPCGFLLQQGHFASIGNESIMIHSLKWGCCHLADTSSAERLWLHGNHGFLAFCGWAPMEKFHTDKLTKTLPSPIYDWRLLEIRFVLNLITEGCNKRVSIYSLITFTTFSLPLLPLFLKENVWILLIP